MRVVNGIETFYEESMTLYNVREEEMRHALQGCETAGYKNLIQRYVKRLHGDEVSGEVMDMRVPGTRPRGRNKMLMKNTQE